MIINLFSCKQFKRVCVCVVGFLPHKFFKKRSFRKCRHTVCVLIRYRFPANEWPIHVLEKIRFYNEH